MPPPPSFTDLASVLNVEDEKLVNVIGIVTDILPPKLLPRNDQYMFTFTLLDQSFTHVDPGPHGLMVRCFVVDAGKLPNISGVGDIVLLRSLMMKTYAGRRIGLFRFSTRSLIFRPDSIPTPAFEIAFSDKYKIPCIGTPQDVATLTLLEQKYVINLRHTQSTFVQKTIEDRAKYMNKNPTSALTSSSNQPSIPNGLKSTIPTGSKSMIAAQAESISGFKFRLVSEICKRSQTEYVDIIGQVVKRFESNEYCDLYVTDYTANDKLYNFAAPEEENNAVREGDIYGYGGPPKASWPGPWGYLVFKINVKPPHSTYANQNVDAGDFVLLQNIKCRNPSDGSRLEGTMWYDWNRPDKLQIRKLVNNPPLPEVEAILRRKTEYWSARKRTSSDAIHDERELGQRNGSKKKKKKKEKGGQTKTTSELDEATAKTLHDNKHSYSDVNRHVRCSNDSVRITSVKDILDTENVRHTVMSANGQSIAVPFVNARYRARVHVVDYEPKALEDFSVMSSHMPDDASDSMAWVGEDSQQNSSQQYKWHFRLLLEDASCFKTSVSNGGPRIWVDVRHDDAQFLFGNGMEDPKDLRSDTRQLAKLRERLFILWGNLEENGGQKLSNLLFECCIMEYGIEKDGEDALTRSPLKRWKRVYSMFGTTIL